MVLANGWCTQCEDFTESMVCALALWPANKTIAINKAGINFSFEIYLTVSKYI
jgi:hypothetical protein